MATEIDNDWRDNFALAIISLIAICGMTWADSYLPAGNLLHSETILGIVSLNAIYAGHRVGISWTNGKKKAPKAKPEPKADEEQLPKD